MASSEHFSDAELRCQGKGCNEVEPLEPIRGCGKNECKPELLEALEDFRAKVGKPVIINSAYRCPIHNAEVGGAPNSQHMLGEAADIRVTGMTAGQLEAIARTIPAIKGIGRADFQNYLHVDVRSTPEIECWCYDGKGATIKYYTSPDAVISA